MSLGSMPTLNACLNAASALLLTTGFLFIRRAHRAAHRACMLAAVGTSTLFLISYVAYHVRVGSVPFRGTGWVRPLYFGILISHTILAMAILPLVAVTLTRALRERFDLHARIARFTLPIWIYVSVTGVVVYWMLYHLN